MACNKNSPDSLCDRCRQILKQARRSAAAADKDDNIELCDDCSRLFTDSSPNMHCVEATILVNNGENSCRNCSCRACLEREFLCKNDEQNVNDLQKSWIQLRHNVRQMYRDRLLDNFVTGKGKKIDAPKIKALVYKEYIMEVKVQLLQILLIPRQIDDGEIGGQTTKNETGKTLMSDITPAVAEHFLKCLVKLANEFLDTLEKMLPLLERLNDHLAKFQVNWLTVNYSLLDEVFFKDPLVRITLPSVYRILNFPQIFPVLYTLDEKTPERKFCSELDHVSKLFDRECTDLREEEIDDDRKILMQKLFELDSTIFLFDRQMRDARRQMAKFLDEQTKLYHEKLKEKQKMLKEDLEYFKEKRRLLEEYVSKNKDAVEEEQESKIVDDDDAAADDADVNADTPNEDLEAFAEALRTLLYVKRASLNNVASAAAAATRRLRLRRRQRQHRRRPTKKMVVASAAATGKKL
uniref:Uncharacterized protein n=1 Tax=Romanomermis culicivorax TaxID=13658 RepID=A0A915KDE5_ROMCU